MPGLGRRNRDPADLQSSGNVSGEGNYARIIAVEGKGGEAGISAYREVGGLTDLAVGDALQKNILRATEGWLGNLVRMTKLFIFKLKNN